MVPIAAGWYADPAAAGGLRLFTGSGWSEHAVDPAGRPLRTPTDVRWPPPQPVLAAHPAPRPEAAAWAARPPGQGQPRPANTVTFALSEQQRRLGFWIVAVAVALVVIIAMVNANAAADAEVEQLIEELFPRSHAGHALL